MKMYFLGVTTGASQVNSLFLQWMRMAGFPNAELVGIDLPIGTSRESVRDAIRRITEDPDSAGGLVTSHKVSVYQFARDLFTGFDGEAALLGEVSCIVRRGPRLIGMATDVLTSGLALTRIVERPFRGAALILGAGGAGVALGVHLVREHALSRFVFTDPSLERVHFARRTTGADGYPAAENDRLLESMPPGSLIVNASGMGKDRPGSPLSSHARFPPDAIAWDFNYRGDLLFLEQARKQGVRAVDGREYFLHGWTQILSRVFDFELTPSLYERMERA